MKKETRKFISTVLSATTIMSMLTAVPVTAVDTLNNKGDTAQEQTKAMSQTVSNVADENSIHQMGKTGDRTLEYGISEDTVVIDSVGEYYKLKGKKYKVPSGSSKANLPSSVDNSQSIYFPEIGNQGQIGSCVAFAQAYYQFTYEMNRLQGIATTPENTFSPKWLYNIYNGAWDFGSTSEDMFKVMAWQGVAPVSLVPYDDDYKSWMPTEEIWSTALKYKIKSYQYFDELGSIYTRITSADDSDLDAIKTALSNGEVLTCSTYISSWKTNMIRTNPMAPENYKYEGLEVITAQDKWDGSHRMAIVGYNDNIWTDINRNFQVDPGEMGAFKVVNSWGKEYGNDGFMWIAYDALNEGRSCVEGAPIYGNKTRIFECIARIEAEPVKENSDMYLRCTFSTLNRSDFDAYLIAEKDGSIYTEVGLAVTKYQLLAGGCALDGTNVLSDGTLAFALNNVVPDISSENFHEYSWSVKLVDKDNDGYVTNIKDVAIVDAGENKVYTPQGFAPFTLDGSEKTLDITKHNSNNLVIYYVGYYNPTIHYKIGDNQWQTVKMEANTERYGYTHKLIVPSENIAEAVLYFTDENGNVDDNNGNYYKASSEEYNFYVTEGQAKPLSVSLKMDSTPDVKKLIDSIAKAEGGYAPYRYEFSLINLKFGSKEVRKYDYSDVAQWYIWTEGQHRLTVNVKDQSNNVVTSSIEFYVEDMPFRFASLTAEPDKQIMTGDTINFTAVSEFERAIDFGATPSMYDIVIRKADTKEIVHSVWKRADESDFDYKYSVNYLSWSPTQAGDYTITISSTDGDDEYAEKTLEFTVHEYNGTITGDANNDKNIDIRDALIIMKYAVDSADSSDIWLKLSDCNDDKLTNIRDVIFILKYLIYADDTGNVGKVNGIITPTEPETMIPSTEPITEIETLPVPLPPPTEPETMTAPTEPITEIETLPVPLPPPTAPPTELETMTAPTEPKTEIETLPVPLPPPTAPPTEPETMTAPTEPETMIPSTEPKTEIETLPVPLPPPTAPPTEVESIVPTEVESAVPTEPETLPVPPQPPIFPDNSNVVGFLNSEDWSGTIYCYYWSDTNKAMTVWPGEPMLKDYYNSIDGKEIYWYALPKDATYVIFTNGSMQTVDIWYNAHEMYIPTTKDSKGHYNVKTR